MSNPNLAQHAKVLDRTADTLEAEAKRLRETAELIRTTGAVMDPLMRAIEAVGRDAK